MRGNVEKKKQQRERSNKNTTITRKTNGRHNERNRVKGFKNTTPERFRIYKNSFNFLFNLL